MTKIEPNLPWWMPRWLWEDAHTPLWGSAALGGASYYAASLLHDVTGWLAAEAPRVWIALTVAVMARIVFACLTPDT